MAKKALLLNSTYEFLSFVPERKVFKLLAKDKVDIISTWNEIIRWSSGSMKYPSILIMKIHVIKPFIKTHLFKFSRKALIKRDKNQCQYCGKKLVLSQITVDHVLPKSNGGVTSFLNCVICCFNCNNKKSNKTLECAGMKLINKPIYPSFMIKDFEEQDNWHPDWNQFIKD
jgi:uncharacterized protein with PIN domain